MIWLSRALDCLSVMTGQFLSRHVAIKQVEGKTFQPRRSSSVTMMKTFAVETSYLQPVLLLRVCSRIAQSYLCRSNEPLPNYCLCVVLLSYGLLPRASATAVMTKWQRYNISLKWKCAVKSKRVVAWERDRCGGKTSFKWCTYIGREELTLFNKKGMSTRSINVKPRERHSESCKSLSKITRATRGSRIETKYNVHKLLKRNWVQNEVWGLRTEMKQRALTAWTNTEIRSGAWNLCTYLLLFALIQYSALLQYHLSPSPQGGELKGHLRSSGAASIDE